MEQASENRLELLKERTLGIEVFERDPQYDTNQDPVVRTAAGEVRKRLAQYYLEPGHEEELRISLPAGSYVPEVHPSPAKINAAAPPRPAFRMKYIGIAMAVIAMVATAVLLALRHRQTDLERFWAPLLEPQETVLVCIGQPKTYNFKSKAQSELDKWFASGTENQNPSPGLPTLSLDDVVPMWDRYVGLGDAQAFSQFSEMFAKKGKKSQLRGARSVTLADLRSKPCVLIGAFNNEWTMSLAGELRFFFDIDHQNNAEIVNDRQNPGKTEWKVVNSWPHRRIPADYAIVSRVLNPTTEQAVVIVAGITYYGTHAAGEFLTNEAYFSEALNQAPRDWYRKNMQVVLSTKVISGAHGPPKVLAVHFW
ncbi:MAG TPA: hypothetical protein VJ810_12600 [Blastocatellia bacterium]|nr:hypothetical protein [Blastocatellia bacterium]